MAWRVGSMARLALACALIAVLVAPAAVTGKLVEGEFVMPEVEPVVGDSGLHSELIESAEVIMRRRMRLLRMRLSHGASEKEREGGFAIPATANLVCYLSGENVNSGSIWEDQSGNNNSPKAYRSEPAPVTVSNWGSQFRAMRFRNGNGLGPITIPDQYTIMIVDRYFGPMRGRTLNSGTRNNWLVGKWANHNGYFAGRWIFRAAAPANNEFSLVTATQSRHGGNRLSYGYLNGKRMGGSWWTNHPGSGYLGWSPYINAPSDADVAAVMVWNKVLTGDDLNHAQGFLNEKFSIWAPPFIMPTVTGVMENKGEPGTQGSPGFPGNEGAAGERGPTGQVGIKGDDGVVGPTGNPGEDGGRGPKGDQGPIGKQGPRGPDGPLGPQGPKGDRGDDGKRGSRGPKGNTGIPGPKGAEGDEGMKGPRGDQGPMGDRGTEGAIGEVGDPGIKGEDGNEGDQGDKGLRGDPGQYPKGKEILKILRPRIDKVHESNKLLDRILERLEAKDRWQQLTNPPRVESARWAAMRARQLALRGDDDDDSEEDMWGPPTSVEEASVEIPVSPLPGKPQVQLTPEEEIIQRARKVAIEHKVEEEKAQAIAEGCPPGQEPIKEGKGDCPSGQEPDTVEEGGDGAAPAAAAPDPVPTVSADGAPTQADIPEN